MGTDSFWRGQIDGVAPFQYALRPNEVMWLETHRLRELQPRPVTCGPLCVNAPLMRGLTVTSGDAGGGPRDSVITIGTHALRSR